MFDIFVDGNKVAQCGPGDSFGELALMYNSPRAATVRAATDGRLWALDRGTFRHILMATTSKKRQLYEQFLSRVPLLANLLPYERSKVADALVVQVFEDGEDIVTQVCTLTLQPLFRSRVVLVLLGSRVMFRCSSVLTLRCISAFRVTKATVSTLLRVARHLCALGSRWSVASMRLTTLVSLLSSVTSRVLQLLLLTASARVCRWTGSRSRASLVRARKS